MIVGKANAMKALLIICDGLGDEPDAKGRTPLAAARKPNMDRLAREAVTGLMHAIGVGVVPGSDTAHLSLFGYDPMCYYSGRGVFEALGVGMRLEKGDVAFRCNFATVDKQFVVRDRRAGRIRDEGKELAKEIDGMTINGVKCLFRPSVEHRGALVLRGKGLSFKVSDADPHKEGEKVLRPKPLDDTEEARRTADILYKFVNRSYELLRKHPINLRREKEKKPPANILLPRGAGVYEKPPQIGELYGLRAACVAGGALYKGVARFAGMDVIEVKGATGRTDTDVMAKARAALDALRTHDFVFLHVKGTDSASHDGNFEEKRKMIERIDGMVGELMRGAKDAYIVITGDHSTSCKRRRHTADPVPIAVWGSGVRRDGVKAFDEFSCASGGLGHIRGLDVMPIILDLLDKAEKYGS